MKGCRVDGGGVDALWWWGPCGGAVLGALVASPFQSRRRATSLNCNRASEEQSAITCDNASSTLLHPFLINCS